MFAKSEKRLKHKKVQLFLWEKCSFFAIIRPYAIGIHTKSRNSTIAKLLLRYYDYEVEDWEITIDGVDIATHFNR